MAKEYKANDAHWEVHDQGETHYFNASNKIFPTACGIEVRDWWLHNTLAYFSSNAIAVFVDPKDTVARDDKSEPAYATITKGKKYYTVSLHRIAAGSESYDIADKDQAYAMLDRFKAQIDEPRA